MESIDTGAAAERSASFQRRSAGVASRAGASALVDRAVGARSGASTHTHSTPTGATTRSAAVERALVEINAARSERGRAREVDRARVAGRTGAGALVQGRHGAGRNGAAAVLDALVGI